jgi:hypothetical protein
MRRLTLSPPALPSCSPFLLSSQVIEDEAQLDQASLLPAGATICANEVYRGSPASLVGRVAPLDRKRIAFEEPSLLRQVCAVLCEHGVPGMFV